jgi:TetR/AcrR family transcriptional repressor of nem operon
MKQTQEHPPTKERLLEAAQRLMLAKGYEATSVEEICQAAGVTKGSFFHYFECKEDLGKAALDAFVSSRFQAMQQAAFLKKTDPLQRVYGYVDFLVEMMKRPDVPTGCLLGNLSQELSDTRPEIRTQCAKYFDLWSEAFKRDLDKAKARYASEAAFDTRSLAEHLIAVIEGSLILSKTKQDKRVVEKNLSHYKQYLKSLFGK